MTGVRRFQKWNLHLRTKSRVHRRWGWLRPLLQSINSSSCRTEEDSICVNSMVVRRGCRSTSCRCYQPPYRMTWSDTKRNSVLGVGQLNLALTTYLRCTSTSYQTRQPQYRMTWSGTKRNSAIRLLQMSSGADHLPTMYLNRTPSPSTAIQNDAVGHETEEIPFPFPAVLLWGSIESGADHLPLMYDRAFPKTSTAMQNKDVGHETEVSPKVPALWFLAL